MTKFLMQNGWRAALCGAVLALTQSPCFAQSTSGAARRMRAGQTANQPDPSIPPAIAKELAAMRQKINGVGGAGEGAECGPALNTRPAATTDRIPP